MTTPTWPLTPPPFPRSRLRRNRMAAWSRDLVRETRLHPHDLILPVFVIEGQNLAQPVATLPGVERLSIDRLVGLADAARLLGIRALALFPVCDPACKSVDGAEAARADNLLNRAARAVKAAVPDLGLIADVALDPYTPSGHDGIVIDGHVANDATVDMLTRQAVAQADAGFDIIAPSDMMDGRIGAIRDALDRAGHAEVRILAYAAKYASGFYGPFRDALGSGGDLGPQGKLTYQMDPANGDEALRETALDLHEGADMVMVKPGMPYLDILYRVKAAFQVPTAVYQVSGEYAMIHAAAAAGMIDKDRTMMEALLAFKRAGADMILTYWALEAARRLT